jgi:hypothetical protein
MNFQKGPPLAKPEASESFLLAGYGNMQQNLSYLSGVVHDVKDWYFYGQDNRSIGPFILGTGVSSPGDSGKNDCFDRNYNFIYFI